MPALALELCGSHTFGGDSDPVFGAASMLGSADIVLKPSMQWVFAAKAEGDAQVQAGTVCFLQPHLVAEGTAKVFANYTKSMRFDCIIEGSGESCLGTNVNYSQAAKARGSSEGSASSILLIQPSAFLQGAGEFAFHGILQAHLVLPVSAEAELLGAGVTLLNLHLGTGGDSAAMLGLNVQYTLLLKTAGKATCLLYPLRFVEGMALPLEVNKEKSSGQSITLKKNNATYPEICVEKRHDYT